LIVCFKSLQRGEEHAEDGDAAEITIDWEEEGEKRELARNEKDARKLEL